MKFCKECGNEMIVLHDDEEKTDLQCKFCGYSSQSFHKVLQASPISMAKCMFCGKSQKMVVVPEYSKMIIFCDEECFEMEKNRKR